VLLRDSLGLYCAQWEYEASSWSAVTGHPGFVCIEERFFSRAGGTWTRHNAPGDLLGCSSSLKACAEGCALVALSKRE
jgi:hypothetical protein